MKRKTPEAFRPYITNSSVLMLPLVRDLEKQWRAGWCTYPDGFDENPDIEVMSGGDNHKTPKAAAIWRQGNLLHFGFEQSPAEMNETGQKLLLNAIAYISKFTEDRPIAVTPSVFAGSVALPRAYLDRRVAEKGDASEAATFVAPTLFDEIRDKSKNDLKNWYAGHRSYLHPAADRKLEVDADAKALSAPLDTLQFFERAISNLDGPNTEKARALLARYSPEGITFHDAAGWQNWFQENRDYLFFSDQGDYRWHIDPLAKKRGVASKDLRGPARASR